MNKYLDKIAAYTDKVMYMRTALGGSGAGPDTPSISAKQRRERFGMPQEERDLVLKYNSAVTAEKNDLLEGVRKAYRRYGIQNANGPILNLTKNPVSSHPAMGPVGLKNVVYKGNWPVNPLSVPRRQVSSYIDTDGNRVLELKEHTKPSAPVATASTPKPSTPKPTRGSTPRVVAPMSTGSKIALGTLAAAGLLGGAYHLHKTMSQEKKASLVTGNKYLDYILE